MTRFPVPQVSLTLQHLAGQGFVNLIQRLTRFSPIRKSGKCLALARHQQHFGTLDDQLLNDLGLQRSEIRAAEYGILPGDQALHHTEAVYPPEDGKARTRR